MRIKRDIYLDKLIRKQDNGLIKVVTGLRRCGKSYLLFNLFKTFLLEQGVDQKHIIEIAFDSYESESLRDPQILYPFLKDKLSGNAKYYVLLDEVQLLNDFESILNSLLRMGNACVFVTGSNAKFLSRDVITEFRGRGDEIHMNPLSFKEFTSVYPGDKRDALDEYMRYGGLPSILGLETPDEKIAFLKSIFEETYILDIVERHKIRNQSELEDLLNILSSSIGSLTNPPKLVATFRSAKNKKISPVTIKKYIDYLCDSYLIDRALQYNIKGKRYIGTPVKYYFTDLGLRNARLNFRQQEPTHMMENLIFNELKVRGFNVDVGVVDINGQTPRGKSTRKRLEIDFICNKGSERLYIQSAYTMPDLAKMKQEQRPLTLTGDSFKKIIITRDTPSTYYNENGIQIMGIYDFLENPTESLS